MGDNNIFDIANKIAGNIYFSKNWAPRPIGLRTDGIPEILQSDGTLPTRLI